MNKFEERTYQHTHKLWVRISNEKKIVITPILFFVKDSSTDYTPVVLWDGYLGKKLTSILLLNTSQAAKVQITILSENDIEDAYNSAVAWHCADYDNRSFKMFTRN